MKNLKFYKYKMKLFNIFCIKISLLIVFCKGNQNIFDENMNFNENENFLMSQRGCFSAKFGLEYLRQIFDTIFH